MDTPRKVIIVAAGMGQRLGPNTCAVPKCLVPVGARTILGWQLAAYRACGIDDIVIVRGYLGEVLAARQAELGPGIRFVDNLGYRENNILLSLLCAEAEIEGPILVSYSDIIFTPAVVRALVAARGDVCLVIDRDFAQVYEGRTEHPFEQAEVSDLTADGLVARVGKQALPAAAAYGEFIGLCKLSATGSTWLRDAWRELCARYRGREDEPFMRAPRFRVAYLTDLLQHLIDAGRPVHPVSIRGQWREIDTVQDLARARALLGSGGEWEEDWT
jgi:choline kinase